MPSDCLVTGCDATLLEQFTQPTLHPAGVCHRDKPAEKRRTPGESPVLRLRPTLT